MSLVPTQSFAAVGVPMFVSTATPLPVGPTGSQGPQGPEGPVGSPGAPGQPGATGVTGPTGAVGTAGTTGATGPAGTPPAPVFVNSPTALTLTNADFNKTYICLNGLAGFTSSIRIPSTLGSITQGATIQVVNSGASSFTLTHIGRAGYTIPAGSVFITTAFTGASTQSYSVYYNYGTSTGRETWS